MLNHKHSMNVYLEKICSVVQYIMVLQTDFTVLISDDDDDD
jgi:hypothetical protein